MSRYITIVWVLLLTGAHALYASNGNVDIQQLRKDYYNCVSSSSKTNKLYDKLNKLNSNEPIMIGFVGALEALKAKHAWNPYNKMKYLDKASKTLSKAIKMDPDNIELRFLRYTVEFYVPDFLGYSKNLEMDRRVIINQIARKNFPLRDKGLMKQISSFIIEKTKCSTNEISLMQKAVN